MQEKETACAIIEENAKELNKAGLIFVSKSINALLNAIVNNDILNEILHNCAVTVDYAKEYQKACVYLPSGNIFNMPTSNKRRICLIAGLLYEFEHGTLLINKFLKDFYSKNNVADSFTFFCNDVIAKFVLAYRALINGQLDEDDEELENQNIVDDGKVYKDANDVVKDEMKPYIEELINLVTYDDSIKEDIKDDIITILDGLAYSFEVFNSKIIKTIWIAYTYVTKDMKALASYNKQINKLLETFSILD